MTEPVTITVECSNCHSLIPVTLTVPYAVTSHTDANRGSDPYVQPDNLPDVNPVDTNTATDR